MDTPLVEIPPKMLTPEQLIVIKYTWHLVLNDTSNICLNFFHQLQRRFPHIKRLQKADHLANSTPSLPSSVKLMTRNRSCTTENNHQNKQSLLPQHALKLACCIDSLIGMYSLKLWMRAMSKNAGKNPFWQNNALVCLKS